MPSGAHAFRMSSANGVSASAISVVTMGTSSPWLRSVATSSESSLATLDGSTWPPLRTVISTPRRLHIILDDDEQRSKTTRRNRDSGTMPSQGFYDSEVGVEEEVALREAGAPRTISLNRYRKVH